MTTFGVFGVNHESRRCNTIRSGTNIEIVSLLANYFSLSPGTPIVAVKFLCSVTSI